MKLVKQKQKLSIITNVVSTNNCYCCLPNNYSFTFSQYPFILFPPAVAAAVANHIVAVVVIVAKIAMCYSTLINHYHNDE